eukprot:2751926-Amphidinium_carterae.1
MRVIVVGAGLQEARREAAKKDESPAKNKKGGKEKGGKGMEKGHGKGKEKGQSKGKVKDQGKGKVKGEGKGKVKGKAKPKPKGQGKAQPKPKPKVAAAQPATVVIDEPAQPATTVLIDLCCKVSKKETPAARSSAAPSDATGLFADAGHTRTAASERKMCCQRQASKHMAHACVTRSMFDPGALVARVLGGVTGMHLQTLILLWAGNWGIYLCMRVVVMTLANTEMHLWVAKLKNFEIGQTIRQNVTSCLQVKGELVPKALSTYLLTKLEPGRSFRNCEGCSLQMTTDQTK